MPLPEGVVSIRFYAKTQGCSDSAVHKAINNGYIVEGVYKVDGANKGIYSKIANAEWNQHRNPNYNYEQNLEKESRKIYQPSDEGPEAEESEEENNSSKKSTQEVSSLAKVKLHKAAFEAKTSELKYRELNGELIKKDEVYKALYEVGQQIRVTFLELPDRIIDELLSLSSREEAYIFFREQVASTLDSLSNFEEVEFKKR